MKIKLFMMLLALQFTAQAAPDTPATLLQSALQNTVCPNDHALLKNCIRKLEDLGIDLNTPVLQYRSDCKTPAEELISLFFSK
jgi:hypothetical protein